MLLLRFALVGSDQVLVLESFARQYIKLRRFTLIFLELFIESLFLLIQLREHLVLFFNFLLQSLDTQLLLQVYVLFLTYIFIHSLQMIYISLYLLEAHLLPSSRPASSV